MEIEFIPIGEDFIVVTTREDGTVTTHEMSAEHFALLRAEIDG